MTMDALFHSSRQNELKSGTLESYIKAFTVDAQNIFDYVIATVGHDEYNFSILLEIDPDIFTFSASTTKDDNAHHNIHLSLGTLIAIDDFASLIEPYFASRFQDDYTQNHTLYNANKIRNFEEDPYRETRYCDYGWLKESKHKTLSSIGLFPQSENTTWHMLVSNFMLANILFHEIGHILLGHNDFLSSPNKKNKISEKDRFLLSYTQNPNELGQTLKEKVDNYQAMEFHADIFSGSYLVNFFLAPNCIERFKQKLGSNAEIKLGSGGIYFPKYICCYTGILLQICTQKLVERPEYLPPPMARVLNTCAATDIIERALIPKDTGLLDEDIKALAWHEVLNHLDHLQRYLGLRTLDQSKMSNEFYKLAIASDRSPYSKALASQIGILVYQLIHWEYPINLFEEEEDYWADIDSWHNSLKILKGDFGKTLLTHSPLIQKELILYFSRIQMVSTYLNHFDFPRDEQLKIRLAKKLFLSCTTISEEINQLNQVWSEV